MTPWFDDSTELVITDRHLQLLRRMEIGWDDTEFGAPCVDPKRPYGNSDVHRDIAMITDYDAFEAICDDSDAYERYFQEHAGEFDQLHRETRTVLQILLTTGGAAPGLYQRSQPWRKDWRFVGNA